MYIFLCLVSELLAYYEEFLQIVSRQCESRFKDKVVLTKPFVIKTNLPQWKKKLLFAGFGLVHIVKNRDLGLKDAARSLRPQAAFPRSLSQFQFSLHRPTLSQQITFL